MRSLINAVTLFSLSFFSSFHAFAQNGDLQIKQILANVANAVRTTNYSGRLTYEHSGQLEVVEIAHAVFDGVEYERVNYLNGPSRSVVKSGREADCKTHGGSLLGGSLMRLSNGDITSLAHVYDFKFWGEERIADRKSWVLRFAPKDKNRHSFILAVDQESYLPTKALFVAGGRKVLERIHLVSLDTETDFKREDFVENVEHQQVEEDKACPASEDSSSQAKWRPRWVPKGFILSSYDHSPQDGHMETYTDGLASFSIFTKELSADPNKMPSQSLTSRWKKGATVVSVRLLNVDNTVVQISVLGEIPNETADSILASVSARYQ